MYQSQRGGQTLVPLDMDACIIGSSTPRFGKMVSDNYGRQSARPIQRDLAENHGRKVSLCYIQNISNTVGKLVLEKEPIWQYSLPGDLEESAVQTITLGRDGAYVHMKHKGYREAMSATIGLYDGQGQRLHTIYLAEAPEYGKACFNHRFSQEIQRIKKQFPKATYVGLADGAPDNWSFLRPYVDVELIDFYHAVDYLAAVAEEIADKEWLDHVAHQLKHEQRAAVHILQQLQQLRQLYQKHPPAKQKKIQDAITYFENHHLQMNYAQALDNNLPIGSGITEAACKVIIKQRLCNSGMKWVEQGAKVVLALRCMSLNETRWTQFWKKLDKGKLAA